MNRRLWLASGIVVLACGGGGGGGTGLGEPPDIAGTWTGTVFRQTDTCPPGNSGLSTPVGAPVEARFTITQTGSSITVVWTAEAKLLTGVVRSDGTFNAVTPNTDPPFLVFVGTVTGNRLTATGTHSADANDGTGNFVRCGGTLTYDLTRQ